MPRLGFEPTIAVIERAKTVHALDRAVTVIGKVEFSSAKYRTPNIEHGCLLLVNFSVDEGHIIEAMDEDTEVWDLCRQG
jgi:hypothetical protein